MLKLPRRPGPAERRRGLLLGLISAALVACAAGEAESPPHAAAKFSRIPHEPSGIVSVAPGLVLIVEDEKEHPFDLLQIGAELSVSDAGLSPPMQLNDLEGVTRDASGRLYAVTSHSTDSKGKRKENRERLVRFRIDDGSLGEFQLLERLWPEAADGFEIEGLAWDAGSDSLIFGLRPPASDGRARWLRLANPDAAFAGAEAELSEARLDLDGQGIRGIEYDEVLGGFVVIGSASTAPPRFDLWLWDGKSAAAERLAAPGFGTLRQPEGLCSVEVGSSRKLLVVSDDGTTDKDFYKKKRSGGTENRSTPGSYLFIDYESIARPAR